MKLWLNDAIGNKDSIEIGFDVLATDGIDTAFNEVNIFSTPWSNDFEVRAGDAATSLTNQYITSPTIFHSKKQIISKTCDFFHLIKIAVNCKNFPLVIKWDTSAFSSNSCDYSSFITSGTSWGGDWFDGVMAFMNPLHDWYNKDSIIISELGSPSSPVIYTQNNQEIIQLNVSFGQTMPTTSIYENRYETSFEISPNPVQSKTTITFNSTDNSSIIYIYDILGKLVFEKTHLGNSNTEEIDLSVLPKGMYCMIIKAENKIIQQTKLIKL
jgi:hypothetical protein